MAIVLVFNQPPESEDRLTSTVLQERMCLGEEVFESTVGHGVLLEQFMVLHDDVLPTQWRKSLRGIRGILRLYPAARAAISVFYRDTRGSTGLAQALLATRPPPPILEFGMPFLRLLPCIVFLLNTVVLAAETISDLPYGADPVYQALDVHTPSREGRRPVMVYVHGGSWTGGDKRGVDAKPAFFNGRGWVLVSVNYRLVPTVTWQRQPEDVAAAIAWVHAHIAQYGGDPARMYLMGHSAGCHLVSLVTVDASYLAGVGLTPAVLLATVALDTQAWDLPYLATLSSGTLGPTYTTVFGTDPATWALASPTLRIRDRDRVAPIAIAISGGNDGGDDPERTAQAERFRQALVVAGVQATVINGQPKSHGAINRDFGTAGDAVTVACMDFIEGCSRLSRLACRLDFQPGWGALPAGGASASGDLSCTEIENLTGHQGRLYAGTGALDDSDTPNVRPDPGAQVLCKDSSSGSWRREVHFGSEYLSVEALASLHLAGSPVLLAGPFHIAPPFETTVWAQKADGSGWVKTVLSSGDESGRTDVDDYHRSNAHIRAFGRHTDASTGTERIFAGDALGRIWTATYDAASPTRLHWATTPENADIRSARVMGFAEADGVLYASITPKGTGLDRGGLYRRVDGTNPRWEQVWNWYVADGDRAYPLRGLGAVTDPLGGGRQVLIGGQEEPGVMQRFDPVGATVTVELDVHGYFTGIWGSLGRPHPIAAFNDVTPAIDPADGLTRHLIGMWVSEPQHADSPHNGDHLLIRHPDGRRYEWMRVYDYDKPVPNGQELLGVRALCASPFADEAGRVWYLGGYDVGRITVTDTAWIMRASLPTLTHANWPWRRRIAMQQPQGWDCLEPVDAIAQEADAWLLDPQQTAVLMPVMGGVQ